jgi:hypothetical protein
MAASLWRHRVCKGRPVKRRCRGGRIGEGVLRLVVGLSGRGSSAYGRCCSRGRCHGKIDVRGSLRQSRVCTEAAFMRMGVVRAFRIVVSSCIVIDVLIVGIEGITKEFSGGRLTSVWGAERFVTIMGGTSGECIKFLVQHFYASPASSQYDPGDKEY